jgi:hypothetical protein
MKPARILCIAVVAALALGGCGDTSTPAAQPPAQGGYTIANPPPTNPTLALTPVTTPEANCPPSTFPDPLTMQPETADEARLLGNLDFCTLKTAANPQGMGSYLHNRDQTAVWVLDQPANITNPANPTNLPLVNMAFRTLVHDRGLTGATLEPGRALSYPSIDPSSVHAYLNVSAQAAWQVLNLTVESVQKKAASSVEAAAVKVLGGSTSSRQAAVTCAFEGFHAGQSIRAAVKGSRLDALQKAIDVASAGSKCSMALDAAKGSKEGAVLGLAREDIAALERTSKAWSLSEELFGLAQKLMRLK